MARLVGLKQGGVIAQALTDVATSAQHALGSEAFDEVGNTYRYLKGIASTSLGSAVAYYEDGTTALYTETLALTKVPLAVAQAAIVANSYGWYAVAGEFPAAQGPKLLVSCAKEVAIYATTTDGSLDDAGTTKIQRLIVRTTITTAAQGAVWMNYPSPVS